MAAELLSSNLNLSLIPDKYLSHLFCAIWQMVWLVMLNYKVKSSVYAWLISPSVRSTTFQMYTKHNHSNTKCQICFKLRAILWKAQSAGTENALSACWWSTPVCVYVCVGGSLSVQGHSLSGDQCPLLWLTQCGGVFPLCQPCGRSVVILPKIKQASSVAAIQFSTWATARTQQMF